MQKKRFNFYSVEDQMEKYNITKEQAESKISLDKEKRKNKWNIYSVKDQMERYNITKEQAEEKIILMKNVNTYSVDWQMERFSLTKDQAEEKILTMRNKVLEAHNNMSDFNFNSMMPSKKEHWIKKGFSDEESIIKSNENIKMATNNVNTVTKDRLKNPEKYIGRFTTDIEYYRKKGFSDEDAKIQLSKRQSTFSLKKCLEKYGEIQGPIVWKNRQEKWNKSLLENGNLKVGFSKISQELFNIISTNLQEEYVFYGTKNEKVICDSKNGFMYDFTYVLNKKIIEFNGDVYHGNPKLYKKDDRPHPFKDITAEELWKKDQIRINFAKSNGFDILTIWESDYKQNKNDTIALCLGFLNS